MKDYLMPTFYPYAMRLPQILLFLKRKLLRKYLAAHYKQLNHMLLFVEQYQLFEVQLRSMLLRLIFSSQNVISPALKTNTLKTFENQNQPPFLPRWNLNF